MGCGASKETAVATPSSSAPNSLPQETAQGNRNKAQAGSKTTSGATGNNARGLPPVYPTNGSNSKYVPVPPAANTSNHGTTGTGSSNNTGTGNSSEHSKLSHAVMVANLNDVVHSPDEPQGRGRFLSYASGASTPNTSSGNLSWDGNSGGGGSSGEHPNQASPHNIPSEQANRSKNMNSPHNSSRKNPKSLKSSGSAIGLDELMGDEAGLTSKVVHIEVPFGKPIEDAYDGVHNGPVLGSGVSGLVRLVTHKKTGIQYAVKCLDLGLIGTKEGLTQLREEIFIMCQLDHPNIVRLEEVYESHSEIYLVQELCLGGELFDRLDEQPDYHYTEAECARLVKQMLSAVRYLHSKGIIHRDLKLENFLFSSKATDSELKMIDFGLSKHFQFGEVHHEAVGTPYTVAPEVIHGSYDERCDIWAIGVITFLLLSGDPPFGGCGGPEPLLTVRANILACKYEFEPEDIWGLVSQEARDFVKFLLILEPKDRPTAREAQKHSWLKGWASRGSTNADSILNPNVVKALVSFKEFSHMRKLLSEVLSFTLLPEQIKELRKEFEKVDTDGSGEISLKALKQVLVTNAGAGSLGALTEEEVVDIFNAMRVDKAETTIHWHEFIAAGLSQCQVDDRNLRLAFDRLDADHKGFITLDDIMNLVGNDELHSEEHLRSMWRESMKSVNCTTAHITYDNFLLLMKGQTTEPTYPSPSARMPSLGAVPEGGSIMEEEESTMSLISALPDAEEKDPHFIDPAAADDGSHASLPNLAVNAMYESSSSTLGLTQSPVSDSPASTKPEKEVPQNEATAMVDLDRPGVLKRGRSKSLADEKEATDSSDDFNGPAVRGDTRRALALPERDARHSEVLSKNQSAIVVNRQLYRAHRQMRLSVMDASRRFEEQQARRARDTLMAQKVKEAGMMGLGQAGLVMRHGHRVQVTTENIRQYLEDYRAKQKQLLEKATKRGGRRGNRKKTISDMSAMMNPSLGQDELGEIAAKAHKTPDVPRHVRRDEDMSHLAAPVLQSAQTAPICKEDIEGRPSVNVVDRTLRNPTVPGQFHQTKDPFSSDGRYGSIRMGMVDVNQIKFDVAPEK